jgi:E3 SUMO-protein ligase PIAS1
MYVFVTFRSANHCLHSYVSDILSKTPRDLEQVIIEVDGGWKVPESPRSAAPRTSTASLDLDDLEVSSSHAVGTNKSSVTPSRSFATSIGTPPMSDARNSPAVLSRPGGGTSSKRPAAAVIDLTLSSDEEDAAPPAPKRQQLNHVDSSFTGSTGRH